MTTCQKISFLLLLCILGCKETEKDKAPAAPSDRLFDKVRLTDLENNSIDLKQYNGKTVFLNFWATWCKPCIVEMPSIEKAQNILENEEIVFLMASSEMVEEINAFKVNNKYKFVYARVENSEEIGIQALPTTFIFDREGVLVFSEMGSRVWDDKNNIDMIRTIISKK
ncbi:MAG: TlpA disulfide reductase family protein [Chitinophagaceae bacterium]